jgi:hypothetical protein
MHQRDLQKKQTDRRELDWIFGTMGETSGEEFAKQIMANQTLSPKGREEGIKRLTDQAALRLSDAQAKHYETPKTVKPEYGTVWGTKDGATWEPLEVAKGSANEDIKEYRQAGYTDFRKEPPAKEKPAYGTIHASKSGDPNSAKVIEYEKGQLEQKEAELREKGYDTFREKEPTEEKPGEFERLLNQLEKTGKITTGQKEKEIRKRIQKLVESGKDGDETNKITLGDGQSVTLAELRAQYREKYNIPDEFELQMMELNPDPLVRQQATRLKAEAATKPNFVDFMMDAKKNGLEGLRPEAKRPTSGSGVPPPPPGFTIDR